MILILKGMIMDDRVQAETNADGRFCPQCGAAEDGFFCRNCGALLRGKDHVLCPRCHQIVPDGEYCNQCGQGLGGLALHLGQLAFAGDAFWVTSGPPALPAAPEEPIPQPDDSVVLEAPELPDWLQELSVEHIPAEAEPRVYPALQPLVQERTRRNKIFIVIVISFLIVLFNGLVFLGILILLRTGV